MGEELQELATKEIDLKPEPGEEEASPKGSPFEMAIPRKLADAIPLFGMLAPSLHVDASSVRESVSSTVPK